MTHQDAYESVGAGNSQGIGVNPGEITRAVRLFLPARQVTEIRVPGTSRGTVSGYFDIAEKFAAGAALWSGKGPGVYAVLNPVKADLLARANNHLVTYAKHTTSDTDITRRTKLPLDFDPIRAAGISSTDVEHEVALARAGACRDWLVQLGFPRIALALGDSGNGGHVIAEIDLPNNAESTVLVKRCIEAVALHFSDDQVVVDLTVFNPARIWKVYGTLACKGDATPDRPHRLARILEAPDVLTPVPRELLERLAGLAPEEPKQHARQAHTGQGNFDLERWIAQHNLEVGGPYPWNNGGKKWIFRVCPWNPDHTNRSACIVQFSSGAIAAKCHHNGCVGKNWHDLRDNVEPGWGERWKAKNTNGNSAPPEPEWGDEDKARTSQQEKPRRIRVVSIGEFLSLEIKLRGMVLSPIIPTQGLVMLYSFRGVGKTFVAIGMAYAAACGGTFLKWKAPQARRVLFVDGELPAAVLQERIARQVEGADVEPPDPDYFRIVTPDLQELGIPDLSTPEGQAAIEEHLEGIELLVLDNLSTLCRSGEENAAESWLPVQEWILRLRRRGLSVLMVHHGGKSGAQRGTSKREDVLDTVICLKRPADYEPEHGARFEVHFEKARGIHGEDAVAFEAKVKTAGSKATWAVLDVEADLRKQVVELLKQGKTQRYVATALGISVGKVNTIAKKARAEGSF
jgi:hypothetical protein